MKKFAADFETNNDVENCRVWAFSICEIGNPEHFIYGTNIEEFIKWCSNPKENYTLYFHNLKFDGEFIISYLLNNGFTCIKDREERCDKSFTCLISDLNQFFSMEIFFCVEGKKTNRVLIYDSLKILNFPVEKIAKDFNLPIRKLDLDYDTIREEGHVLTEHEIDYIRNDVEIMARALDIMFQNKLTKMTIAGDALENYKEIVKNFKHYFPVLPYEIDQDMRDSYRGGFTYLNDCYVEKTTGAGLVLDVNSLYPSVMYNDLLPFGEPMFFEGEYKENKLYPLYIQTINCSFDIKEGKIPTIQIKKCYNSMFNPTEYIKSSNGDIVTLKLTSVDLKLFKEHYDIHYIEYVNGFMFKGVHGLFKTYIDKWSKVKIESQKSGNGAMRTIAKLLLNSLYGKFGLNPNIQSKYPVLDENGIVSYKFYEKETRDSIYLPMAAFITSYARLKTISTSQAIKDYSIKKYGIDMYIYSDTDSIHTLMTNGDELKQFVDIDDFRIGAWKIESSFVKGRYLRAKSYIELGEDDKLNCTVAGLPKNLGELVDFDNFDVGSNYFGKLVPLHCKGGIVLKKDYFTIRRK